MEGRKEWGKKGQTRTESSVAAAAAAAPSPLWQSKQLYPCWKETSASRLPAVCRHPLSLKLHLCTALRSSIGMHSDMLTSLTHTNRHTYRAAFCIAPAIPVSSHMRVHSRPWKTRTKGGRACRRSGRVSNGRGVKARVNNEWWRNRRERNERSGGFVCWMNSTNVIQRYVRSMSKYLSSNTTQQHNIFRAFIILSFIHLKLYLNIIDCTHQLQKNKTNEIFMTSWDGCTEPLVLLGEI